MKTTNYKNKVQTNLKAKYRRTVRSIGFKRGVAISLFFIATPFIFYLYRLAPQTSKVWETEYFTITSGGWGSVQTFIYHAWIKIIAAIGFSIWFFTCKHWWRYSLLVPFTMYLYQFSGVINHKIQYFDDYEFILSLPLVLPIVLIHIVVAYRLRNKKDSLDLVNLLEKVDQVIENEKEALKNE